MTKKVFRNITNDQLYEVWAEVVYCGDLLEGEDKYLVVYSAMGHEAPEYTREKSDFYREFVRDDRLQLFKFYSVDSLPALVEAQARHIERLQAQLPPTVTPAYTRPREG